MADFTYSTYSSPFSCFLLFFSSLSLTLILIPKPISSSALHSPTKTPNFDSEIALYGDAELAGDDDGARVRLTRPSLSSSGLLLRRIPFRLLDPNGHPTSFSTDFAFSVTPGDGDGVELVFVPADFGSRVSGESNRLVVAVVNASSADLGLKDGEKLKSWIDYDASSKRLEVRLAKFGESRPYDPKIAYAMDLPAMWKSDEDVLIGISSSTDNSPRIITIFSWNFRLRSFPNSMHSLPADPRGHGQHFSDHQKRRVCPLAVLGGLIFATVCGALMAFAVLFLWAVIASNKHTVSPADHQSHVKSSGFRYEKIGVVVEKDSDDDVKN